MIDRMGTRFLQETLNDQLGKHIKEKLPGLRSGLQNKIRELNDRLKDLGYFDQTEKSKIKLLYKAINKFVDDLETNLEGNSIKVSGTNLKAGANINRTMYDEVYGLIKSTVSLMIQLDYSIYLTVSNPNRSRNQVTMRLLCPLPICLVIGLACSPNNLLLTLPFALLSRSIVSHWLQGWASSKRSWYDKIKMSIF